MSAFAFLNSGINPEKEIYRRKQRAELDAIQEQSQENSEEGREQAEIIDDIPE